MLSKTCAHLKSQQSETQDATSIETLGLLIDVYTVETGKSLSLQICKGQIMTFQISAVFVNDILFIKVDSTVGSYTKYV